MAHIWLNYKCFLGVLLVLVEQFPASLCASTTDSGPNVIGIYDTPNGHRILNYKGTNALHCNVTGTSKPEDYMIQWSRGGSSQKLEPVDGDLHFRINNDDLIILNINDEILKDQYTCTLISKATNQAVSSAQFTLYGKPTTKIVSVGTFIQGQPIQLECQAQGFPKPHMIEWRYENVTFVHSFGRFKLKDNIEKGIPNYYLSVDDAELTDRGEYACRAHNSVNEFMNVTESTMFVRVKDKFAALWPFIGICAEVVVLCTIIFVYERKRNKAELEESDTEQSPEQKNTPDHGKESVRQRK